MRLATSSDSWLTTGNNNTNAATNFIGTTNMVDLVTKTNNIERMRITANGLVGIGTNPSYKLDINHSSAIVNDRAFNVNYSTSDNIGGLNSAIYVNTTSTGTGDAFGIFSIANPSSNNNSAAVAGIINSTGLGDRIAIASQLTGTGNDGIGVSSAVTGCWTNAYGLYIYFSASSIVDNYGLYVKGTPTYSGFMENGIFYVNDNMGIGLAAVTPTAKLHVDGNIKSSFLTGANNRILYTNSAGQITALANGTAGDVLTINGSNIPVWGSGGASGKIFFKNLSSPFTCNSGVPSLLLSKTFIPINDTVIVEFKMSAIVSSAGGVALVPFEVVLELNGSGAFGSGTTIHKDYGHPNANTVGSMINISFSVPMPCAVGSNKVDIFIRRASGTAAITTTPASFTNASVTIYDLPTNQ